jgi:hypothetical protein
LLLDLLQKKMGIYLTYEAGKKDDSDYERFSNKER